METTTEIMIKGRNLQVLDKDETLKLRRQHIGPSVALWFNSNPLKIVQGKGQYLYDENGVEYLDCINNVAHVGHANKRVVEAISNQLSLLNTNSRFLHDNLSLYAQRLCALFPKHLSVCYLVNSGSEANDLAIRLARAFTHKTDIVGVDGAYHGNLISTMAVSPYKNDHMHGFEAESWAHVAPLPCAYRGIHASTAKQQQQQQRYNSSGEESDSSSSSSSQNLSTGELYAHEAIKVMERAKSRGREIAAFIVESMVSCGGQFPLPSDYLRTIQAYLRREPALLICDEVQTGFGRCGKKMWAFQLDGDDIKPDIVTIGKPMGNGFPVSAVVTTPEIAEAFNNIGVEYFNTFGGNPASCAAALAVLEEIEDKKLVANAEKVGAFILSKMREMKQEFEFVGDVRGFGFFLGMEIVCDKSSRKPAPQIASKIVNAFRNERILMSTEGKFGNVLKFKPPMVFNDSDAARFVRVLYNALKKLSIDPTIEIPIKPEITAMKTTATITAINRKDDDDNNNRSKSRNSASSTTSSMSSGAWMESSYDADE